jgi:hypothetical protein
MNAEHKLKSAELLPCPFCGSCRVIKGERYFAMCVDCGATGPERQGDKAGIKKLFADWNTRDDKQRQNAILEGRILGMKEAAEMIVIDGNPEVAQQSILTAANKLEGGE